MIFLNFNLENNKMHSIKYNTSLLKTESGCEVEKKTAFKTSCKHYSITFDVTLIDLYPTVYIVQRSERWHNNKKNKVIHLLNLNERKESLTNLFHNVISVPDAGGIKKCYRNATNTDTCFNHITSGSSNFSNYCPLTLHATRRPCSKS